MKKLILFALVLILALTACAKTPAAEQPSPTPDEADTSVTATPEATPTPALSEDESLDDYVSPYVEIGGIGWSNSMPTESMPVFIIESVNIAAQTITANRGYLQEPIGVDLYDYSFQFQLLRTRNISDFELADNVRIYFAENLDEPVLLSGLDALAAKIDEGYIAWRFEAVDAVITSLTNVPWRERLVYEVVEPITAEAPLHVQIFREVTYPRIEDNRRLDSLGLPAEMLNITSATEIFTDRFYGDMNNPHYDEKRVESTVADLQEWYEGGGRYVYVERDGVAILSVYGIYSS